MASHVSGYGDSQYGEGTFELGAEEIGHPQEEDFAFAIGLGQHGVLMVEIVERLGQLEGVSGDVRGLAGCDGFVERGIGFRDGQKNLPRVLRLQLTGQRFGCEFGREVGQGFAAGFEFAENITGADGGVLNVGSGFAFKAERFLEVESDDGVAGELQQEVAERANGDFGGDRERRIFLLWMTQFFALQLERTLAVLGIAVPAYM